MLENEIVDITHAIYCESPLDGNWHENLDAWKGLMHERFPYIHLHNEMVAFAVADKYGINSPEAKGAEIVAKVSRPEAGMAMTQLDQGYRGIRNWQQTSPTFASVLEKTVEKVKNDPRYTEFLKGNAAFRLWLNFQTLLLHESDPTIIHLVHDRYLEACANCLAEGKIVPLAQDNSDYIDPQEDGVYRITEANLSLLLPLEKEDAEFVNTVVEKTRVRLNARVPKEKQKQKIAPIVGRKIAFSGFEVHSNCSGEKLNDTTFFVSVNTMKHAEIRKTVLEKLGLDKQTDMRPYFILLTIIHEMCHQYFPYNSGYNEVLADMPMIVEAIRMVSGGQLKYQGKDLRVDYLMAEFLTCQQENSSQNGDGDHPLNANYYKSFEGLVGLLHEVGILNEDNSKHNFSENKLKVFMQRADQEHQKILTKFV